MTNFVLRGGELPLRERAAAAQRATDTAREVEEMILGQRAVDCRVAATLRAVKLGA